MNGSWGLAMSLWRTCALAFALTAGASISAWAQNAIQSINSSQQAGSDIIRIELAQPLATVPNGFSVQTPPRVAIDLPGVTNALGKSSVDINQGNLRSINVAQSGERSRLVLNLKQPANYRAELQGNTLLVMLDGAGPTGTAPVAAAPKVSAAETALGDIRPDELTPREALEALYRLKGMIGEG